MNTNIIEEASREMDTLQKKYFEFEWDGPSPSDVEHYEDYINTSIRLVLAARYLADAIEARLQFDNATHDPMSIQDMVSTKLALKCMTKTSGGTDNDGG